MTAPLRATPHASAIPASQNTAPVAEFRCLFTHDIRRKQKRWQDGFLKFHTFNNRVMVYDTSRNFLGDTYWKDSNHLQEGDELTLDKGVMVEVADAQGVTQTDLTPLFEKKNDSPAAKLITAPNIPRQSMSLNSLLRGGSQQLRHKSLNSLLNNPRGPIGKATPVKSPYEVRQEQEDGWMVDRTPKRQKIDHMTSKDKMPVARDTTRAAQVGSKPIPQDAAIVTIDSDPIDVYSDITLPSPSKLQEALPPPIMAKKAVPSITPGPTKISKAPETSVVQTPRLPRGKLPLPQLKETPKPSPPPSSPPVSVSNRFSSVDFAPRHVPETRGDEASCSPPLQRKTKSLRLATGRKRGVLRCEAVPQQRDVPRQESSNSLRQSVVPNKQVADPNVEVRVVPISSDDHDKSNVHRSSRDKLVLKRGIKEPKHKGEHRATRVKLAQRSTEQPPNQFDDDIELIHGLMDQQIYPADSPKHDEPSRSKSPTENNTLRTSRTKKSAREKQSKTPEALHDMPPPDRSAKKVSHPKDSANEMEPPDVALEDSIPAPRRRKKVATESHFPEEKHVPTPPILDPVAPVPPNPLARPTRTIALSTGGFRKKNQQLRSVTKSTSPPAPAKPSEPSPPPLHPLRADRPAPLMTTTELSALLQLPHNSKLLQDDPIEEATQPKTNAHTSPTRAFQRSRSENDAPIPSLSAEWEERNAAKEPQTPQQTSTTSITANTTNKANPAPARPKESALAALVKKTDPRRRFQRTRSLNIDTGVGGANEAAEEANLPSPVVDTDIGPWSTEADDLFDWKPPGREKTGMLVDET